MNDPAQNLLRVLMGAKAETAEWWDLALCAQVHPDLHYPEKGETVRAAKQICMACEVRLQCLDYAIDRNETFGIWGGKSARRAQHDEALAG